MHDLDRGEHVLAVAKRRSAHGNCTETVRNTALKLAKLMWKLHEDEAHLVRLFYPGACRQHVQWTKSNILVSLYKQLSNSLQGSNKPAASSS